MTDVRATVEIDRPAAEVFDYLADMANNPEWQRGQQRCTCRPELRVRICRMAPEPDHVARCGWLQRHR